MIVFYVFQLVLNYLTLHNISKEYTLKNGDVWDANLETNCNECDNEVIQIGKFDVEDINELSFNAKY